MANNYVVPYWIYHAKVLQSFILGNASSDSIYYLDHIRRISEYNDCDSKLAGTICSSNNKKLKVGYKTASVNLGQTGEIISMPIYAYVYVDRVLFYRHKTWTFIYGKSLHKMEKSTQANAVMLYYFLCDDKYTKRRICVCMM